jgi:hypothetical protein
MKTLNIVRSYPPCVIQSKTMCEIAMGKGTLDKKTVGSFYTNKNFVKRQRNKIYLACAIAVYGFCLIGAPSSALAKPVDTLHSESAGVSESTELDTAPPKFTLRAPPIDIKESENNIARKTISANYIDLPGGGVIWSSEDPTLGSPTLNFSTSSLVAIEDGKIEPINLSLYTNYSGFITRLEILIFKGDDRDLINPIFVQELSPSAAQTLQLELPPLDAQRFVANDELRVMVRAYDKNGRFDETYAQVIRLIRPEDRERQLAQARFDADTEFRDLSSSELETRKLIDETFLQNQSLRLQNIEIYGSSVRINGQDIPEGYQLTINQASIPIDQTGKFFVEYLLPIGQHNFHLELIAGNQRYGEDLSVEVTGKHLFLVALADITASKNRVTGSVEPLEKEDRYDDSLVEGRLAFYLKGKIKGKYLITAHADTDELPMGDLFDGFFKENPRDIFRRLDPDAYYPVYGDDSFTVRDVDTQGKLYVRVNWDKNEAIAGNYYTGITGTRYGYYSRSLYGAAIKWRSRDITTLGDAKTEARVFGAEAQTSYGHSEFLGTGGSLYYLKHTDVLPGSEQITLEIRDSITGNIESRVNLIRGIDYDIDELQGRVILARPLMQIAQEASFSISRNNPLGDHNNILLIDYEYYTRGLSDDEATGGVRARHWFGNHFALGTTYVRENRELQDYELAGVDARLQAGRGTYLAVEKNKSEASATSIFVSDNGGLSFNRLRLPTERSGDAVAVDARANLQELGYTERTVTLGAWYRDMDAGFSVSRYDYGRSLTEQGAELSAEIIPGIFINARYSEASRDTQQLDEALAQIDARLSINSRVVGEVRYSRERLNGLSADGTLAALRYQYRFSPAFEAYIQGQTTLDDDQGLYEKNDLVTLGGTYTLSNLSTLGAEASKGTRGDAYRLTTDYRISSDHTVYAAYTWSTDTTATYDPLFNNTPDGLTLGQRWRVSNNTNLFNESQWLKTPEESGIAHTYGMDFYPTTRLTYGFTLQKATLDAMTGNVDRRAYSLRGGYTEQDITWRSAFEWREDSGAESRDQWVSTNHLSYKYNADLRFAGRINFSETEDNYNPEASAKFNESNLGFAYRPHNNTRWAVLGKYTYLYDLSTLEQTESVAWYDQKSHIVALEGTYHLSTKWAIAAKYAERHGEARESRGQGDWYDSRTRFVATQARYALAYKWNAVAEYRWLDVEKSGDRDGWLVGVDRNITEYLRLGVGYNFTDFSDDLRRHDYEYEGWFLNLVGYY